MTKRIQNTIKELEECASNQYSSHLIFSDDAKYLLEYINTLEDMVKSQKEKDNG